MFSGLGSSYNEVELSIDGISTSYLGGCGWRGCSLYLANMNLTETQLPAGVFDGLEHLDLFLSLQATSCDPFQKIFFGISAVWKNLTCRATNWEHFHKVFFGILVASAVSTCRTTVWRICPAVSGRTHVDLICLFLLAVDDFPSFVLELTTFLGKDQKSKITAMLLMTESLCQLTRDVFYWT